MSRVSRTIDDFRRCTAWALLPLVLGACSESGDSPTSPGVDPDAPESILIEGHIATDPGSSTQLTAIARYADGREVDVTAEASWTASDPASASVEAGLVSGHVTSSNDLLITYAGVSQSAPFYVARLPYRGMHPEVVQESPITGSGSSAQLRAIADFTDRGPLDVTTQARWESWDESIATVTDDGVVTGVSTGRTSVLVSYRGYVFGAEVEVGNPPEMYDVQVNPQIFYTAGARTCDSATNLDGRDGEFSIQINVITPDGTRHLLLETPDYPSNEHVVEVDADDELSLSSSHPGLVGPGVEWFRLSELQSLEVELRVTEWDLFFEDFGDPVQDADMSNEVVSRTHYGAQGFGSGDYTVSIAADSGNCTVSMEYIINAQ